MRIFLFTLLCLPFWGQAQNSEAYTDKDLQTYLDLSKSINLARQEAADYAHRMQAELLISNEQMEQTLMALKERGSWEALEPDLDSNFAKRFNELMTYRATLKARLKENLQKELAAVGWTDDFYQHLVLTIQADPKLQERLIQLSKKEEQSE
ncbi:hypothetical protein [Croceimicrobium sp.]|uniref:hypothetical protein n=1 Tax=Croceimicrobium sp. TaxID=2828340 RepID=UPI003BAD4FE1